MHLQSRHVTDFLCALQKAARMDAFVEFIKHEEEDASIELVMMLSQDRKPTF